MNFQMSYEKNEIRVLLRFFWKKGLTAATREICKVERKDMISKRQQRFNREDFSQVDISHSGRSSAVNDEALRAAVEVYPLSSIRKLSATFCPSKDTMNRHLHRLGLVLKSPRQDTHELTNLQA